jgi:phospholipase/carboxylesterase
MDRIATHREACVSGGTEATYLPLRYEAKYAYPLIVWLHDEQSDHRQLLEVMPHLSLQNYVAVAVRGLRRSEASALKLNQVAGKKSTGPAARFGWPASDASEGVGGTGFDPVSESLRRIDDLIDATQSRYNIHADRIFIAGYRSGGTMAIRAALAQPQRFAGALNFCGDWPQAQRLLAQWHAAQQLQLFWTIGRDCPRHREDRLSDHIRAIHAARLKLELRQYSIDDSLATTMLQDANAWIMGMVTGNYQPAPCIATDEDVREDLESMSLSRQGWGHDDHRFHTN